MLPIFTTYILEIRLHFEQAPIFYTCANILGKRQYFDDFCNEFLLDFVAANFCVYFQYLFMHFYVRQYFCVLKPRFKIDVVVMIISSIVIIINSVLTLQVSTASLPHDCELCEIKVVFNHT
jgi:hypothetical protein